MTASAAKSEPPYARIVAEIRRRIEAGELREGDRIPSARQITKEWGVAIATATKVLATLRQEGLVQPLPGVGTVVAASAAAPHAGRATPPAGATEPDPARTPARGTEGATTPDVVWATPPDAARTSARAPDTQLDRARAAPRHTARTTASGPVRGVAPVRGAAFAAEQGTARGTGAAESAASPASAGTEPSTSQTRTPKPGRRRAGREHELTRERILRAGIEIADAEGLAALSMRRIATELDVATMSLYRHVPSKDELVVLMYDAVFGDVTYPDPPPPSWRECLELGARTQWSLYRRHPWVAQAISFTRPIPAPKAVVHTEWMLRSMDNLGLADQRLLHIAVTVANYVRGTAVNFEMEAEARRDTGITDEEWMAEQDAVFEEIFADGRYPIMGRIAMTPDMDLNLDSLFEFGLARLLDGIEVLVTGEARPAKAHGVGR